MSETEEISSKLAIILAQIPMYDSKYAVNTFNIEKSKCLKPGTSPLPNAIDLISEMFIEKAALFYHSDRCICSAIINSYFKLIFMRFLT